MPKTRRSLEVFVINAVGEVLVKIKFLFVLECFYDVTIKIDSRSGWQIGNINGPKGCKLHIDAFLSVSVALALQDERPPGDLIDAGLNGIQIFVGGLNPSDAIGSIDKLDLIIVKWLRALFFPVAGIPFIGLLVGSADFKAKVIFGEGGVDFYVLVIDIGGCFFRDSAIFCDIVEALRINQ